jgi:hypothetical protein
MTFRTDGTALPQCLRVDVYEGQQIYLDTYTNTFFIQVKGRDRLYSATYRGVIEAIPFLLEPVEASFVDGNVKTVQLVARKSSNEVMAKGIHRAIYVLPSVHKIYLGLTQEEKDRIEATYQDVLKARMAHSVAVDAVKSKQFGYAHKLPEREATAEVLPE